MNCRETQASFDERLDQRLDDGKGAAFEAHIGACPACAAQWRAYEGAWAVVARHSAPNPSVGFAERTLRRLDEKEPVGQPESGWRIWTAWRWAAVSALALAMAVGWFGWQLARRAPATAAKSQGPAPLHAPVVSHDKQVEVYAMVTQDQLEDFDVIASLHLLNGGNY